MALVLGVLMVLAREALPSWLGSQQEENEQETAVYVGSSQGIVEYLFIYLAPSYSKKDFRQGDKV